MRRTLVWSLTFIVAALAFVGAAIGAPSTVSYQGRLTSSSGTPVADGSYSVSFSIWTDSVAGSMIWSESQTIQVTGGGGLFSTQLGSLQPLGGELIIHGDDDLFLQTAVSGTPLLPRLAVGSVPHAFASSSVSSVIPGTGSMHMSVGTDTTKLTASHESAMGLIDSYLHLVDDRALLGLKAYDPAQSYLSRSSSEVTGASAQNYLDHDDDADGVAESGIWEKVDNTDVISVAGVDVDEDGDTDVGNSSSAKISRSILKTFFERGDKPTQSQIVDSVDEDGAFHGTTRYTGSDFEGFHVSLMPDSAVVSTEASNPDGSSSSRMRVRVNDLESRLQSIGILARSSITSSTTPISSTHLVGSDTDDDGIDNVSVETRVGLGTVGSVVPGASVLASARNAQGVATRGGNVGINELLPYTRVFVDDDADGEPECLAEATTSDKFAQVRGFKVEITGRSSSFGSVCDSSGASSSLISDDDGDTVPESEISHSVTPTTSSVAIKTKGTGADPNQVVSQSDTSGAGTEVSAGAKNIGLYVRSVGSCQLTMTDGSLGTIDTTIIIDGALKRFGIGVSQPDYPMHHSSGAHLTAGGVWTNASDADLKENFQPIDGAELLNKLEDLPISQWNYKSESGDVTHIGPTAQDFQKAFGVGENDKTISTIDPSGIALAAIKELNKQNLQLQEEGKMIRNENERLQKELNELKARVDRLIIGK